MNEGDDMGENGLVGSYTHTLDSKNRVFFPAKYRDDLGSPIVITVNIDGCLSAYSMNEWTKFLEKLKSLPKTQSRSITRFFCGNAQKVIPDGQGRVMLAKELTEFAKIEGSVTFVGCGDRVEMWAAEKDPLKNFDSKFLEDLSETMMEPDI